MERTCVTLVSSLSWSDAKRRAQHISMWWLSINDDCKGEFLVIEDAVKPWSIDEQYPLHTVLLLKAPCFSFSQPQASIVKVKREFLPVLHSDLPKAKYMPHCPMSVGGGGTPFYPFFFLSADCKDFTIWFSVQNNL